MRKAAAYVLRILSVFGIVDAPPDRLDSFVSGDEGGDVSGIEALAPFVNAFAAFRDQVHPCALCCWTPLGNRCH